MSHEPVVDFLSALCSGFHNAFSTFGQGACVRRANLRALDLLVAFVTELAATALVGWLIYEVVVQWARITGRM